MPPPPFRQHQAPFWECRICHPVVDSPCLPSPPPQPPPPQLPPPPCGHWPPPAVLGRNPLDSTPSTTLGTAPAAVPPPPPLPPPAAAPGPSPPFASDALSPDSAFAPSPPGVGEGEQLHYAVSSNGFPPSIIKGPNCPVPTVDLHLEVMEHILRTAASNDPLLDSTPPRVRAIEVHLVPHPKKNRPTHS